MAGTDVAVVIGASAGGLSALKVVLAALPANYPHSVLIVQHIAENSTSFLSEYLNGIMDIEVKEALDKEPISPGVAYFAPPGYHLLVEEDRTLSLSVDPPVLYSRPSIDVLFLSAAAAYEDRCVGIVLTGSNEDGSAGLRAIKEEGGIAIVQRPDTAEFDRMPRSAMKAAKVDYVLTLEQIGEWLRQLDRQPSSAL